MKTFGLVVLWFLVVPIVFAQGLLNTATPAQQKIAWAEAAIKAHPDHSQPYNDLAVAYVQRVRETADPSYYVQAETLVQKSFQITPDNREGQKARLMILLGRGEFTQALGLAKELNKKTPDDVLVYGFIGDAAIGLGDYSEAEEAAQWMLDMRPGNVPGLLRGATLRRLYGDTHGATDFFSQAYQQMAPTQTEELAWTLTQMADLQLSTGDMDGAEKLLHSALKEFPDYYAALEDLARVQTARQHYSEAVDLLRQRNSKFPTASSRYALAQALDRAGETTAAVLAYADFTTTALPLIGASENANEELVFYYLGRGHDPAEALRIAQLEIARRHDVNTLDAYAWALSGNGRNQDAQKQIALALAVGVREAKIFYHAGTIAANLGDDAAATRYLGQAVELDPTSESAAASREALQKLAPKPTTARGAK
ncbi:MAG: tetratricopeptide repeat protein [Candidatus Acidiferrales bacterium]|jgi:tetratricopeptide (TPR) repeat protein